MRLLFLLSCLGVTACDVQNNAVDNKVTVTYDKQKIRNGAAKAGRIVKDTAVGVGNVTASTGRAIRNEVGDIDVDVDVKRTRDKAE